MAKPTILEETPITILDLKEQLGKIKERDGELNFRANKTEEYVDQFLDLDRKKHDELRKKLIGLDVPRLKEDHIVKIIDLLPTTADDLKVIMQGATLTISKENNKKIVDLVKGFVKE